MKTAELVEKFVKGSTRGGNASNLYVAGDNLVFFQTVVAQRVPGTPKVKLVTDKYSVSTTKVQSMVRSYTDPRNLIEVTHEDLNPGLAKYEK